MDSQKALTIQLDRLQKVSFDIDSNTDAQHLLKIRNKRAEQIKLHYVDLARQSRYQKAIEFIADDLLGGNQLANRGNDLIRAKKPMTKMLPDALLGTVARSVEFTVQTLAIELAIAKHLQEAEHISVSLSDTIYFAAIRSAVDKWEIENQLELIMILGGEIENVVKKPFVATALRMCRTPAHIMGLGDLQDFLERGFDAFRSMRGSREFMAEFSMREKKFIDNIYA